LEAAMKHGPQHHPVRHLKQRPRLVRSRRENAEAFARRHHGIRVAPMGDAVRSWQLQDCPKRMVFETAHAARVDEYEGGRFKVVCSVKN
jgi:hypothetical protein